MAIKNSVHPAMVHPWQTPDQGGMTASSLTTWVEEKLAEHHQSIADLLQVSGSRTADNTLRPFDKAVAVLSSAASQTGVLNSVHPKKEIRDTAEAMTQKIAEVGTALSLNREVYLALRAMDVTFEDEATRHYVHRTLLDYRLAGVDKDDATRTHLRELHDKATMLSLAFSRNVQEGAKQVIVEDAAELAGLPTDFLESHRPSADGTIVLTTDFPDYMPVMTFATSDALRNRMFLAYNTRAYPQNKSILLDLMSTRQEIATILGYESWADLATANQMMQSAANMKKLIDDLERVSRSGAAQEYKMVLEFARTKQPEIQELDAASRGYWLEQYRRAAFDFDSQSVRPYFAYKRVQKGILETAERLFQVSFERVQVPVWDPSVTAWDVYDGEKKIGRFFLDMHPREGKDKWFSAAPMVPGVAGGQLPVVALICNFPGGKSEDPGLMQFSDVVTFFHEFGHLMHAILGGQQKWAGLSGIATEGDFVEVPSQMLEEFFHDARLLDTFALHYQTNEPLPPKLVGRMNRASAFGRADWVRTQLFYTSYALDMHSQHPEGLNPDALLKSDYQRFLPYRWIEGNRMYSAFTHLVGYSSNYYTYLFDKVIALDFFKQFDPENLLDGPTAMRYRRTVLEPGGSRPGNLLVLDFLDREQNFSAFEHWMGEEFAPA
ncbi:MAG TPA: M3 family metallopeptidase [Acidisarcina sp.]|nr:M3 family metallopeptidase [Acidisarcina sp.]